MAKEECIGIRGILGGLAIIWIILRAIVGPPPYALIGDLVAGILLLMALPVIEKAFYSALLALIVPFTSLIELGDRRERG